MDVSLKRSLRSKKGPIFILIAASCLILVLFQNCSPVVSSKISKNEASTLPPLPFSCSPPPLPVSCPANGIVFSPQNPNFLSLVGNELQIAIAYGADLGQIAEYYRQAKIKNVRVQIDWKNIEATQGTYSWTYTDMRVGMFPPKGINPVGIISNTPRWAAPNCAQDNGQCTPENLDDLRNFASVVVRRYGPAGNNSIHDWEIRVEALPNQGFLTKEQYVAELNAAYAAIKAEDPTARVWGPEVAFISSATDESNGNATQYQWIDYTIANGHFDVFSIHHLAATTPSAAFAHTKRVRERLNAAGFFDVPVAVTATALTNPSGTETQQAQNIQDIYACISAGGADYAFWFAGTEWAQPPADILSDVTYGILDYDFSLPSKVKPKKAHQKLSDLGCLIQQAY